MDYYLNTFIELDIKINNSNINKEDDESDKNIRKAILIQENKNKTDEEKNSFFSKFWKVNRHIN